MVGQCHLHGCQGYLQSVWRLLQRLGELQCQETLRGSTAPLGSLLELTRDHHWVRHIQQCVGCGGEAGDWCSDRVPLFHVADGLLCYQHTWSYKDVKRMEAEGGTVGDSGHIGLLGLCPKGHTTQYSCQDGMVLRRSGTHYCYGIPDLGVAHGCLGVQHCRVGKPLYLAFRSGGGGEPDGLVGVLLGGYPLGDPGQAL